MTEFNSENEARKAAEQIVGTTLVFFTNEGLKINFTNENNNQKEIAEKLKTVFSDVKIKGRKVPAIIINRLNIITSGIRVISVTY